MCCLPRVRTDTRVHECEQVLKRHMHDRGWELDIFVAWALNLPVLIYLRCSTRWCTHVTKCVVMAALMAASSSQQLLDFITIPAPNKLNIPAARKPFSTSCLLRFPFSLQKHTCTCCTFFSLSYTQLHNSLNLSVLSIFFLRRKFALTLYSPIHTFRFYIFTFVWTCVLRFACHFCWWCSWISPRRDDKCICVLIQTTKQITLFLLKWGWKMFPDCQ